MRMPRGETLDISLYPFLQLLVCRELMAEGGESLSSTLAGLRESYYEYNIPKQAEI